MGNGILIQQHMPSLIKRYNMPVLGDTGSNNVGDDVDGPDGGLSPAQHRSHPMVSHAVEESREQNSSGRLESARELALVLTLA